MTRALLELVAQGERIASADVLAEQVLRSLPPQAGSVLMLSAPGGTGLGAGTELTHASDGGAFTITLPAGTEAPRRVFRGARLGALVTLLGLTGLALAWHWRESPGPAARASRAGSTSAEAAARGTPDPTPSTPTSHGSAEPGSTSVPDRAVTHSRAPRSRTSPAGARPHAPGHAERPPDRSSPDCHGQIHVYAAFGWVLHGGPETVQAPGRYEWPCGSYRLKAVSRVDPSLVRQLSTQVRPDAVSVIDLR
jgi:hypothetical protein